MTTSTSAAEAPLRLGSAFQPVLSISHRRAVGFEALVRATDSSGRALPPPELFARADDPQTRALLDWRCLDVHIAAFASAALPDTWLFLNVAPQSPMALPTMVDWLEKALHAAHLAPNRIVIEVLEHPATRTRRFADSIASYRELGCLIAIDDFGAGHSNFDRIRQLAPEIVKLDRSVVAHAVNNGRMRSMFESTVQLLHEAGCLALAEGIETEAEAMCAMDAGVDLAQGYLLGRPASQPENINQQRAIELSTRASHRWLGEVAHREQRMRQYIAEFNRAGQLVQTGFSPDAACRKMLEMPAVLRCFMLDNEGTQLGVNLEAAGAVMDERFRPLANTRGASWARREYFRRALAEPGKAQISRPYLSLTGARLCMTLSIAAERDGNMQVLCCDVDAGVLGRDVTGDHN